jgi:hypothetical protein
MTATEDEVQHQAERRLVRKVDFIRAYLPSALADDLLCS